jgi:hypothetical protein
MRSDLVCILRLCFACVNYRTQRRGTHAKSRKKIAWMCPASGSQLDCVFGLHFFSGWDFLGELRVLGALAGSAGLPPRRAMLARLGRDLCADALGFALFSLHFRAGSAIWHAFTKTRRRGHRRTQRGRVATVARVADASRKKYTHSCRQIAAKLCAKTAALPPRRHRASRRRARRCPLR